MRQQELIARLVKDAPLASTSPKLQDGSRIAVMGGGPAGSFFTYFLLEMANWVGLQLQVDIYEPRNFSIPGPSGCNMDAGIISESLVQLLAAEGIRMPDAVVAQGIDSYVLHLEEGSVHIGAPTPEKRIASVFRGAGPADHAHTGGVGFDAFCLSIALQQGARLIPRRVDQVNRTDRGLLVGTRNHPPTEYDLLVVATGVNTNALRLFPLLEPKYRPPVTVRSMIREYRLGKQGVEQYLGSAFHVFLLDLPGLEFAGIIPKGNYASVCFLGTDISDDDFITFLHSSQVRQIMPPEWEPGQFACHCSPRLQISGALQPYAERMVFVGDSSVSRLYKDGIGAAFRTAKAAARTAIFYGIRSEDFQEHFWPTCQSIANDNRLGKLIFSTSGQIRQRRFARMGLMQMVTNEQRKPAGQRRGSTILWDTFTGSASYRDILRRTLHPAYLASFLGHMFWNVPIAIRKQNRNLDILTYVKRQEASSSNGD